jgi:hypothetical protein
MVRRQCHNSHHHLKDASRPRRKKGYSSYISSILQGHYLSGRYCSASRGRRGREREGGTGGVASQQVETGPSGSAHARESALPLPAGRMSTRTDIFDRVVLLKLILQLLRHRAGEPTHHARVVPVLDPGCGGVQPGLHVEPGAGERRAAYFPPEASTFCAHDSR